MCRSVEPMVVSSRPGSSILDLSVVCGTMHRRLLVAGNSSESNVSLSVRGHVFVGVDSASHRPKNAEKALVGVLEWIVRSRSLHDHPLCRSPRSSSCLKYRFLYELPGVEDQVGVEHLSREEFASASQNGAIIASKIWSGGQAVTSLAIAYVHALTWVIEVYFFACVI